MIPNDFPKQVIEFLQIPCYQPNSVLIDQHHFPETVQYQEVRNYFVSHTIKTIHDFFKKQDSPIWGHNGHCFVPGEALKNAYYHGRGGNPHSIDFGTIITPLGVAHSFFDEGSYFRNEDVKQYWESRILHSEKHHVNSDRIGWGLGTKAIYSNCDLIYIDNIQGVLYTGMLRNNKFF